MKMSIINIVLIEPEIPQNTGNISRTCAVTGAHLHLIGPMGFSIDDKHLKRAGLDYWHLLNLKVYKNVDEFFALNKGPFYFFTTKGKKVYTDVSYPDGCYLVFGKETAGISEELLTRHIDNCVRLPMLDNETARSLNLSNTVAVGAYEVLRQWGFENLRLEGKLNE